MNFAIRPALAAAVVAACALAAPLSADAARVGYTNNSCYNSQNGASQIVAAGHEAVALPSYDQITAPSLSGLSAVLVGSCWNGTNAAVDSAVSAGMSLLVHDNYYSATAGDRLPGAFVFGVTNAGTRTDINFTAAAAPFLTGPGGALNNTSLDNGVASNHGHVPAASLAPAIQVLATGTSSAEVIILEYTHGLGRVVYSTIPLSCYFAGGPCATTEPVATGMRSYTTNLVATYAVPLFISCADEGFTGSKLTLCQRICEVPQSPTTLTSLIRLYTATYRQTPPCAQ